MLIDYLIYFINSQVATVAYLGGGYATVPVWPHHDLLSEFLPS
jgi:hypothetical protein